MRRNALAQQLNIALFLVASSSLFTIASAQVVSSEENVDTTNSIDLGSLVVTASGFAQEVKDAPASISVIGQETINEKPFNNIGDVLKDVEGVNISRGGKSGGVNIGIRGLGNDYTLLLVDGQRLSQNSSGARPNGFGDVDSSFIPPSSAIERIEVVRGPMSTLYGSDALGGVINVITKKVPEKWGGQVSFSIEEPTDSKFSGGNTTSFYVAGPIKNDLIGLALMGSFQTKRNAKGTYAINEAEVASGVHTGKLANFSGLGERKNFNYGARLTFTPENQEFVLSYDRGVQRYENDDNQLGTQNSTIAPGKTGGGYADHMHFTRERIGLTHRAELDFATVESGLLWDQTKTLGRLNPLVADKNSATGYTSLSGAQRDIKYTNIVFDNKWMFSLGDHFISAGMQYRQQKLKDNLEGANIDKKQYQWALFAEDEWMLNDNLIGTLGLRYDKNEDFGSHFSPRAYLVWNINDNWQIKGGVSRAFKAPDVQLMSPGVIGLGRQGRLPLLGNPDLKPETATSAELGFSFDNQDNFRFNATAFYTKFKDRIESQTVANCRLDPSAGCVSITGDDKNSETFSKRFNVDDAKLYGLELGAKFQALENLGLSANYTYTHSRYTNNQGQKIPFSTTPQHMVNLRADWKVAAQWNLWVEGEYRAKEYDDLNWNKEKVYYRNYALVNIGASYKPSREMTINFGVDNLFDKDFVDYSVAQTGTKAPTASTEFQNRYARVEEGRRLWLKMNYEF
ncbi:ferric siderophore receptor [Ignatzschineria ureiclastica]|uniref:Ferric siderophore receptor n=1 Tax=Ignatzschineria ureiclastica TaxID=472582 RepID=A0A2U2AG79_9GAMM|nr:TonB-dependent receptor [Ignatzschineria ureiclastica]PWD81666.1 ferric siderophore receptor [Ignatzschineria ureiclastica]GGZ89737.1 exogenous ferric siderophore receptor [Ignatzschineria ureiclastica]